MDSGCRERCDLREHRLCSVVHGSKIDSFRQCCIVLRISVRTRIETQHVVVHGHIGIPRDVCDERTRVDRSDSQRQNEHFGQPEYFQQGHDVYACLQVVQDHLHAEILVHADQFIEKGDSDRMNDRFSLVDQLAQMDEQPNGVVRVQESHAVPQRQGETREEKYERCCVAQASLARRSVRG